MSRWPKADEVAIPIVGFSPLVLLFLYFIGILDSCT